MSTWIAGADGCASGWVVVLRELQSGALRARVVSTFQSLILLPEAPSVIAIDIPIGLLTSSVAGGRACDALARKRLGKRGSSVFSAPSRRALDAFRSGASYAAVSNANRGDNPDAPGLSQQAFAILPKIAEVDRALTPALQTIVREVHPELSFAEANGGTPMQHAKKRSAGCTERIALLLRLGFVEPHHLLGTKLPAGTKRDDLLDACTACWTASRIAHGAAKVLPEAPPLDARGLRMEIWR